MLLSQKFIKSISILLLLVGTLPINAGASEEHESHVNELHRREVRAMECRRTAHPKPRMVWNNVPFNPSLGFLSPCQMKVEDEIRQRIGADSSAYFSGSYDKGIVCDPEGEYRFHFSCNGERVNLED